MNAAVLNEDMRAVIAAQRLCFAATVTPDGKPSLSPKGTIRVLDDQHLVFLDISSPQTVQNLRQNPWIELNVVDPLSRRGYRFLGAATLHHGDEIHARAVAQIAQEEAAHYTANTVVVVKVERALPLWSPGYDHIANENDMRALWQERRRALDAEFEQHIAKEGPFIPPR